MICRRSNLHARHEGVETSRSWILSTNYLSRFTYDSFINSARNFNCVSFTVSTLKGVTVLQEENFCRNTSDLCNKSTGTQRIPEKLFGVRNHEVLSLVDLHNLLNLKSRPRSPRRVLCLSSFYFIFLGL